VSKNQTQNKSLVRAVDWQKWARQRLTPSHDKNHPGFAICILLLFVLSALALAIAPTWMPEGYSWFAHTISESAAQSLESAWLARLGFLFFGLAVIWLAIASKPRWGQAIVWMHLAFGVLMLATAAFSHKPWLEGVPFDSIEDAIHSFTATTLGFAFSFGVLLRLLQQWGQVQSWKIVNPLALCASTLIPVLMLFQPDIAGLVQRLMFLVAYIWYGKETMELYHSLSIKDPAFKSRINH